MSTASQWDDSTARTAGDMTGPGTPVPHPEVRDYLQRSAPSPDPWVVEISTVRAHARQHALAVRGELAAVASVETVDADGVPGRLYRPLGAERELLIWAHGGGWMHGDLDSCEAVSRALGIRVECAVLAVDYRLAPEHPFPAGLDDVWTAAGWGQRTFDSVAVGGDSSGGNLAAAVALRARDEGLDLAAQLLVYPVLDSSLDTDFKLRFRRRYDTFAGQRGYGPNTYQRLTFIWDSYAPEPSVRASPLASPLRAAKLRGVAPAILVTAEHDFLRGEAEDYVRRLRAEQVPVRIHNYPGQIHGFFEMLGVLSDAERAVAAAGRDLRQAFDRQRRRTDGR